MNAIELRKEIKSMRDAACYWREIPFECVQAVNDVVRDVMSCNSTTAEAKERLVAHILSDRCLATDIMFDWMYNSSFYLAKENDGLVLVVKKAYDYESWQNEKPLKTSGQTKYYFYDFKVEECCCEDPDTLESCHWLRIE